MLAPLTRFTYIKWKFKWAHVKQDVFDEIKRIVERDTLSNYSDLNETLKIRIDARKFQLGVVVSQKGKMIDLYSRKLTGAQQQYIVI